MPDRISAFLDSAVVWLFATLAGGIGYLIRRVFTNQKQIELLQHDLQARDRLRHEDREDMAEIRKSVQRIEERLMGGNGGSG